ncbi:MAG TPA: hypothetical protein VFN88_09430 [Caulobacteraceae bacterium]|nr:hypothetical protein [Caulobacteraceae bacterium]
MSQYGAMSVNYPVAGTAEAALSRPVGRAARESDAAALAGGRVEFVSEAVGPAFPSQAAALETFKGKVEAGPEDRYCALRELVDAPVQRRAPKPVKPSYRDGRRWPEPKPPPTTVWRLSISYWRIVDEARFAQLAQARQARRSLGAERLDAQTLQALARQPLRPLRPQQPLDVGLFEVTPPEAPNTLIADE